MVFIHCDGRAGGGRGALTFLADQEGSRGRFLAERGTSLWSIWLSRQIVAFPFMLLVVLLVCGQMRAMGYVEWPRHGFQDYNSAVGYQSYYPTGGGRFPA